MMDEKRKISSLTVPIESLLRRADEDCTFEYSCHLRRLYPWPGKVETKRQITEFGCILGVVPPSVTIDRHSHDEEETIIVTKGEAVVVIDDQTTTAKENDVIYIPRNIPHQIGNNSKDEPLTLVNIYWDLGGQG